MKTIHLHGELGERFGKKWNFAIDTPNEAFSAIHANTSGFIEYLNKQARKDIQYVVLTKNPEKLKTEKDFLKNAITSDGLGMRTSKKEFHIIPLIQGGGPVVGAFIVEVLVYTAVAIVVGLIVQGIMKMLFKPPEKKDPVTSKSYLFSGPQNVEAQGIPVPLGYGRLRIGSVVVGAKKSSRRDKNRNTSTTSQNEAASMLLESISEFEYSELLCEGPIEGFVNMNGGPISSPEAVTEGIFFNEVPVKNTPKYGAGMGDPNFLRPGGGRDEYGTLNFIMNEGVEREDGSMKMKMPQVRLGHAKEWDSSFFGEEAAEAWVGTSSTSNYQTILYGGAPYRKSSERLFASADSTVNSTGNEKGDLTTLRLSFEESIAGGAKLWSHSVINSDVDHIKISLRSMLSRQKDNGEVAPNHIMFGIRVRIGDRYYNPLEQSHFPLSSYFVNASKVRNDKGDLWNIIPNQTRIHGGVTLVKEGQKIRFFSNHIGLPPPRDGEPRRMLPTTNEGVLLEDKEYFVRNVERGEDMKIQGYGTTGTSTFEISETIDGAVLTFTKKGAWTSKSVEASERIGVASYWGFVEPSWNLSYKGTQEMRDGKGGLNQVVGNIPDNAFFQLTGCCTSEYEFDIEFNIPKVDASGYKIPTLGEASQIQICKFSSELDPSVKFTPASISNTDEFVLPKNYSNLNNPEPITVQRVHTGTSQNWRVLVLLEAWEKRQGSPFPIPRHWWTTEKQVSEGIGGVNQIKNLTISSITESVQEKFLYPHSAMIKLFFDSKNFSQIPTRSYHLKLKKVLVPSNYDPVSRVYDGPWDGLFRGQSTSSASIHSVDDRDLAWTDNPAWIFYDLVTNTRYGLGKFGVGEANVDKWQLYKIAKYCDELVETGYPYESQRRGCLISNTLGFLKINTSDNGGVVGSDWENHYPTEGKSAMIDYGARNKMLRREALKSGGSDEVFAVAVENLTAEEFEFEFGDKFSFKGKRVAFFINENSSDDVSASSAQLFAWTDEGNNPIGSVEERAIFWSSKQDRTIYLKGPTFANHPLAKEYIDATLNDFDTYVDYSGNTDLLAAFNSYAAGTQEGQGGVASAAYGVWSKDLPKEGWGFAHWENHGQFETTRHMPKKDVRIRGSFIVGSNAKCITQNNYNLVEPRFSANMYITDRMQAVKILNHLASIFRGIVAYSGGKVLAIQDALKEPIQLFNNSNVSPDGFSYMGTVKNKRFTAVLVRYNDKDNNFKPAVAYMEDADAINKFGYIENDTIGFGVTSPSQAQRLAKWILHTSQLETETVTFVTGQEAGYLFPGSIIEISDESRAGSWRSGRLLGVYPTTETSDSNGESITVNSSYFAIDKTPSAPTTDRVEITVPAGRANTALHNLDSRAASEGSAEDQDSEIANVHAAQMFKFDGIISSSSSQHTTKGPRGQDSIIRDLKLKTIIRVKSEENKITSPSHGLKMGDRVSFVSEGILPKPLSKYKRGSTAYWVVGATKHTFQVGLENPFLPPAKSAVYMSFFPEYKSLHTAENQWGLPLTFSDLGRDEFNNEGGYHYWCPEDPKKTRDAVSQVMIGSPWAIKGRVGVSEDSPLVLAGGTLDKLFGIFDVVGGVDAGYGWYESTWLGYFQITGVEGWVYTTSIGWIYSKEIYNRDPGSDDIWFWSTSLGWIWTNDDNKNTYWYVNARESLDASAAVFAGWLYISKLPSHFFVFVDNAREAFVTKMNEEKRSNWVGTSHRIGGGSESFSLIGSVENLGYWFAASQWKKGDSTSTSPASPSALSKAALAARDPISAIDDIPIVEISALTDSQSALGSYSIKISTYNPVGLVGNLHKLETGDEIRMNGTDSSLYFDSDSQDLDNELIGSDPNPDPHPGKYWVIVRLNEYEFELQDSSVAAKLMDGATISTKGSINKERRPEISVERKLQGQFFRTISIKEASGGKYEVAGLEYNPAKFDSIDKKTVIKKPSLPMPPQEDMSLPVAPDDLKLVDLSYNTKAQ
jgi:predicted phage tail protein